jgi:hypothetical protein
MKNIGSDHLNLEKEYAKIGSQVAILALISTVVLFLISQNDEIIFTSFMFLFMLISGLIIRFIYTARAKRLDNLLAGENCIATWIYDEKMWQEYMKEAKIITKAQQKTIFKVLFGISLTGIIIIIFGYIAKIDSFNLSMLTIFVIFISFGSFVAWRFLNIDDPRENTKKAHILFSPDALYIEGNFIEWTNGSMRFEEFSYNPNLKIIKFVLYTIRQNKNRHGRSYTYISLPVPPNEEKSLAIILDAYKAYMKN